MSPKLAPDLPVRSRALIAAVAEQIRRARSLRHETSNLRGKLRELKDELRDLARRSAPGRQARPPARSGGPAPWPT